MTVALKWPLHLREQRAQKADLPPCFYSAAPAFTHESMPPEVAVLLPANDGATDLFRILESIRGESAPRAAALFMSDPFVSPARDGKRLLELGVRWVANLPTVDQHDDEFTQYLADVGLNLDMEHKVLAAFQQSGLKIAATISDPDGVSTVAELKPDAVVVLPRVSDFAAGFPSPRQRSAVAQAVRSSLLAAGWTGPLLGFGDEREALLPTQWPEAVDGIVCRPTAIPLSP